MIKARKQDRELDIMLENLTFRGRNTGATHATPSLARQPSYMIAAAPRTS